MVAPSAVVKHTAKTAMRGKFLKCAVSGTVFIFASLICTYVSSLISYVASSQLAGIIANIVFGVFLCAPLFLGTMRFFWRLLWEQDDNVVICFHYFSAKSLYRRALKMVLMLLLRCGIIGLLLFVPAILTDIFSGPTVYQMLGVAMPLWVSNLWVLSVFLKSTAGIILFFVILRYYLAPFLFITDEGADTAEIIHTSEIVSRGTAFDFALLVLSFVVWIAASVFLVPLVFTLPYFITSYLVHCRFSVAQYNRIVNKMNSEASVPTYAVG